MNSEKDIYDRSKLNRHKVESLCAYKIHTKFRNIFFLSSITGRVEIRIFDD